MNKIKELVNKIYHIFSFGYNIEERILDLKNWIESMLWVQDTLQSGNYINPQELAPIGPIEITPNRRDIPWKDRIIYIHFRDDEEFYSNQYLIQQLINANIIEQVPISICGEVGGSMKCRVTDYGRMYYKIILQELKDKYKGL